MLVTDVATSMSVTEYIEIVTNTMQKVINIIITFPYQHFLIFHFTPCTSILQFIPLRQVSQAQLFSKIFSATFFSNKLKQKTFIGIILFWQR